MAKSPDQQDEPAAKTSTDVSHVRQYRNAEEHTLTMVGGTVDILKALGETIDHAIDGDASDARESLLDTLNLLTQRLNRIVRS